MVKGNVMQETGNGYFIFNSGLKQFPEVHMLFSGSFSPYTNLLELFWDWDLLVENLQEVQSHLGFTWTEVTHSLSKSFLLSIFMLFLFFFTKPYYAQLLIILKIKSCEEHSLVKWHTYFGSCFSSSPVRWTRISFIFTWWTDTHCFMWINPSVFCLLKRLVPFLLSSPSSSSSFPLWVVPSATAFYLCFETESLPEIGWVEWLGSSGKSCHYWVADILDYTCSVFYMGAGNLNPAAPHACTTGAFLTQLGLKS